MTNPLATQLRIMAELLVQHADRLEAGEIASAAEAARVFRMAQMFESDGLDGYREMLHREAAEGNLLAQETLRLLSDNPWWKDR
jgi:DNA-binding MurR/RpiR family transcriptional regulator